MKFFAVIDIMPKPDIAEPQGATIERALPSLGFSGFSGVRVGKRIELVVEAASEKEAEAGVRSACERFLVQPVIEDFEFSLRQLDAAGTGY